MTCHNCKIEAKKFGKDRKGNQRYRCQQCRKTFQEQKDKLFGNMYLPEEKALLALHMLVEGNSIRSIERLLDIQKKTILSLLLIAGEKCEALLERQMRQVKVKDLQFDEIWTFCRMKEKTKTRKGLTSDHLGDAYCFVAFERNSKLIPAWHLGRRTEVDTLKFTEKVFNAVDGTKNKIQITTDGFAPYSEAINYSLGTRSSYKVDIFDVSSSVRPWISASTGAHTHLLDCFANVSIRTEVFKPNTRKRMGTVQGLVRPWLRNGQRPWK